MSPMDQQQPEQVKDQSPCPEVLDDADIEISLSHDEIKSESMAPSTTASSKNKYNHISRRSLITVVVVAMLLLSSAILAVVWHEAGADGDSDVTDTEYIVHMSGHHLNESDVHTVFESMRAGEKNLTVRILDSMGANYTLSMQVERFETSHLGPNNVVLLINEELGGYAVGNTTVQALVCMSDGMVEANCTLETAKPRSLMDDNTADVIKHTVSGVVVGSVLITAIVVGQGAFFAAAPAMISAAAGCFPARAVVQTLGGARAIKGVSMDTMLLTSQGFAPMFLSGHHDPIAITTMVQLTTASNHTLAVTPDHYLPLPDGSHKSAGGLAVGDELIVQIDSGFAPSVIKSVKMVQEQGLFNPYTTTGDIVVEGVLASCHSSWFLEGLLSEEHIVPLYQHFLAPVRLLYKISPGWLARFDTKFASDSRALSDVGILGIVKAAISTAYVH